MNLADLLEGRWNGRQLLFMKFRGHYFWVSNTDILIDAALNEMWPATEPDANP